MRQEPAQLTVERGIHGQDEAALRLCRWLEDGVDDWAAGVRSARREYRDRRETGGSALSVNMFVILAV